MGDFYCEEEVIKLPASVEHMVYQICKNQKQKLPDEKVRRLLLTIGEEGSVDILSKISVCQIKKTLSAFIVFMAKKYYHAQTQQFYQQFDYQQQTVSSAESFYHSPPQFQRLSLSSPNSSSSSSVNFSPRNVPLFHPTAHDNDVVSDASDSITSTPPILSPPTSAERTSFQRDRYDPSPSEFRDRGSMRGISDQLLALSKLEFRKFFLILNYIGRRKLEDVIMLHDVGDILDMTYQPMAHFESYIWRKYGHLCDGKRVQYLDWDSGRPHFYHCHVHSDGSYAFKGPFLKAERTHMQQSLGDENILVVKFKEEAPGCPEEIVQNGILVGLRRYRFFVYKDEGKKNSKDKEEKFDTVKCYFVRMQSLNPCEQGAYILHDKIVHEARCMFMHVHMVSSMAKYMARLSLILSTTVKLQVDLNAVNIVRIEDIYCDDNSGRPLNDEDGKPSIYTDGTGYISEDLARKCPQDFFNVKHKYANLERYSYGVELGEKSPEFREPELQNGEPPLLMQCRLFYNGLAVKGTLLVNKKLPPRTIQIRPSMIKVEADPKLSGAQTFNSLEINTPSFKPRNTYLSRTLIALLSYGGVPSEYFFDILKNTLEETQRLYSDEVTALKVAVNHKDRDDASTATSMIMAGVPLTEPHLWCCLSSLAEVERNGLKGGKLPVSDTFYLMGTADPSGTLNPHEVCVILEHGPISGEVLVYRNPGLHFGDIHRLIAVPMKKNLADIVGNSKYGIFFSTKGPRSAASEIANGDFDGDKYWISQNPLLLKHFNASRPWSRIYSTPKTVHRRPNDFSADEMEHEFFQTFLESRMPNYSMAEASANWCALMDRLLILGKNGVTENEETKSVKEKLFQLVDLYYDAIDAPKNGNRVNIPKGLKVDKFPHFLEKKESYHSTSILGEIYDRVESFKAEEPAAVEIKKLPAFEVEIPEPRLKLWEERYRKYRFEMMQALNTSSESQNFLADQVIEKYKQLLYEATDMEKSARSTTDIFKDALAIYHVTYDHAKVVGDVKKCGFAWKVAGPALCRLHAELHAKEHNQKVMAVSPSILHKLLNSRTKEVS